MNESTFDCQKHSSKLSEIIPLGQGTHMSLGLAVFFWVKGLYKNDKKIKSLDAVFFFGKEIKQLVKRL